MYFFQSLQKSWFVRLFWKLFEMLLPSPRTTSVYESAPLTGLAETSREKVKPSMEELSTEPRTMVYHNFLSKKECDHLISLAKPHTKRSKLVDHLTGERRESSSRTSSEMSLKRGHDTIIRTIEKRIADYTSIPIENGEGLKVLHYAIGQKFEPHFDYTDGSWVTKNGGPRMATLLMYLSDVEEGGETVFPKATAKGKLKRGISVKPKMGDALLFWTMKPDGSHDPKSLHGGSPVIKGDKWSATKWLHVNTYKFNLGASPVIKGDRWSAAKWLHVNTYK